jgi:hypothetical protein
MKMVEALCYKPEGRGFESRCGDLIFFNLTKRSIRTMALGFTQPLTEIAIRRSFGTKAVPALKADILTVICV